MNKALDKIQELTKQLEEYKERDVWKTPSKYVDMPKDGIYVGKYDGDGGWFYQIIVVVNGGWVCFATGDREPNYYREATPYITQP